MPSQKTIAPPEPNKVNVSKGFLKDIESLSRAEKQQVVSFLTRLAANPYDPFFLENSQADGDFFASQPAPNLTLYWSLEFNTDADTPAVDANALAKVRILALTRKHAHAKKSA